VRLDSPAPEADLRNLIRVAEDRSPYLDLFRRPIAVTTEVEIVSGTRS
jgi:hypothetical protein